MAEETAGGAPARHPSTDKEIPEEGVNPRGKWASNKEFLLAVTGEIIGLGSFWRFPYLCYRNGGAVFFIPYFLVLFFCGIPVFFLETAVGQYTSEGGVTAWRKICPMFEGVGIAAQVVVLYMNIYFIVLLAWTIFYLYNSFISPLPWSTCENYWNTAACHPHYSIFANPHLFEHDSSWSFLNNISSPDYLENISAYVNFTEPADSGVTPQEEFWRSRVLRMSADGSLGIIHWDLAVCLLIAWVLCYFCVFKGIKSTGKVVYFTATFPYLLLLILFFRGVTLPGAGDGLAYYLSPDFSRLAHPDIWRDAVVQVVYSHVLSLGVLTALGSYNKYNNNCYRDCLVLCCVNTATSIFAGFVVFSVLGFLAFEMNVSIHDVAASGPGLAFIAFPRVLSMLPVPSFWAVLFFVMVFFLGLDTQFVCVESLATAITDMFPRYLRRHGGREILVLVIAVVCFLLGLMFVTEGGTIAFHLIDSYGPSTITLLLIVLLETIVIAWIYGADRFYDNIEDMIGYPPLRLIKYCWLFITPVICGITLIYEAANPLPFWVYGYQIGAVGILLGGFLLLIPLMCIPVFIFVALCRDPNNMTTPSKDLRQARPNKPILTLCGKVIFRAQWKPNRSADEGSEKMMMGEPSRV
ncbi:sodium- and chloride-dependent betaine transporter-like [Cheilinus undulatus]|uniref:sodium- and chloride-dependent betaine transporter-like n=1 Tax=Cheilinus undulatus TaxID=241271 RepID=UPI001BD5D95B|nr:sodium- and chloride-dependent betaine transporter-like [Cheilinus undulatus]XP_041636441.1 sodium- and chloride-dependent betaine transporter-like [Cheilinus undulatus]